MPLSIEDYAPTTSLPEQQGGVRNKRSAPASKASGPPPRR